MPDGKLRLVFWDVQHGNAMYADSPNGTKFVYDMGTGSFADQKRNFSPLQHLKHKWGVQKLHGAVITHPHRDHIDDIFSFDEFGLEVLRRPRHLTEQEIRAGNRSGDSEHIDKYLALDSRFIHSTKDASGVDKSPFLPANNGGVSMDCFYPKSCATSNLNNHSLVTVMKFGSLKVLIPGDNESPSWKELLLDQTFRTAIAGTDILLAPHHGRLAGYSAELFNYISPKLTIISDGSAGDTSVTDKYKSKCSGWIVHYRSGLAKEKRYCLTTRKDKVIVVEMGISAKSQKPFLYVEAA